MVARRRSCGVDVSGKWSGVSGGDVHGQIWAFRAQRAPVPYTAHNPLIVVTVKSPLIHIPLFFRLIPSPISPQVAEEFQTRPDQTAKPRNKTTITDRQRSRFPPL